MWAVVAEVTPLLVGLPTHRSQLEVAPCQEMTQQRRPTAEEQPAKRWHPTTPAARPMEGQAVGRVVGRLPGRRWLGARVPEVAGEPEVILSP